MRMKPANLADDFMITSLKNQLILSVAMELYITVRSSDSNIVSEIAQMKIEGVTIRQRLVIKEYSTRQLISFLTLRKPLF